MDPDVLQLVREERLVDAARLCSSRGDHANACALFERACDWRNAALEALQAREARRALELALLAGDEVLAQSALALVAAEGPGAEHLAAKLAQRGRHDWAARLLEAVGRDDDAARAWERAGEMTRAAAAYERAGEPAKAAHALEVQLRRDPGASAAALALGDLLVRFGKDEAGVRALQRVPPGAAERREALTLLVGALERLGWSTAARDAALEQSTLEGPPSPPQPASPAALARIHGRYDVVNAAASSARARVFEGVDRARGDRVAIKVYADGDRAGFERLEADARALRGVDHFAIVPVREVHATTRTVVLAWMDGGSLEAMLSSGPVPPARAAEIAAAILAALGEAHRLGILHRDVKASNVLFDSAGAARLSDFGAAHVADAAATITAGDLGALATVSPEQREGRLVTAQSDIFSVGVLLDQMLTGARPGAVLGPIPSETRPGLDARHDALIASLTARDARGRPADAYQAREAILSLAWPGAPPSSSAASAGKERPPSEGPPADRLLRLPDGGLCDRWTGRLVECVSLSDENLERARLFARADHDALQQVLRVDREAGCLWLAASAGPLDRALTPRERERLEGALAVLQAADGRARELDPAAVSLTLAGSVVLRF